MSLKAYDLIWVVGKSAAWRYPGEIPDFAAFAPPVPEQLTDLYIKRTSGKQPETKEIVQESAPLIGPEKSAQKVQSNNERGTAPALSVYVNLPTDKKTSPKPKDRIQFEPDSPTAVNSEPDYDFSNLYKRQSSRLPRLSGKIVWTATIALLFGAGILTGLFISDRNNFFSSKEKPATNQALTQGTDKDGQQTNQQSAKSLIIPKSALQASVPKKDSLKTSKSGFTRGAAAKLKKNIKPVPVNKDSLAGQAPLLATVKMNDSIKPSVSNKSDLLYQKIKSHPEDYVDLVTGRYSTGVFGGISSFPVSLTNNSPVKLDIVVVNIDYIQSNEKIFKTESLTFNDLEPGETVTLKAPKSTRGIKINTKIHIVNLRQMDLSSSN